MLKNIVVFIFLFSSALLGYEIPAIKISSSKIDETSIDATKTIQVIDDSKLKSLELSSINELSSVIPNANISGVGNASDKTFSFRGVSNYLTYESSVAVYVDDVPLPFSYGYGSLDFKNIQKIEIFKGPQVTQFGKNAESGVINVYTKEPTKEFSSEVKLGYGAYNTQDFYAVVSSSVLEKKLSYLFSLSKSTSDGYSKNTLTGKNFDTKDFTNFITKLRYEANSNLTLSLNYTKSKIDDGGSAFKVNTKENIRKINNEPYNDFVKMDNDLLAFKVKYQAKDYKLSSLTTYAKEYVRTSNYVSIYNGLLIDLDVNIEEFTQELRLDYDFDNADFLFGTFYSKKTEFDYKENQQLLSNGLNSLNSLKNPDENIAFFSQIKYYFGDSLALMAGARYQETKKTFQRDLNTFSSPSSTYAKASSTWHYFLPTLSVSYMTKDGANTYLTYAQGYRAGGYNYRDMASALVPYKPESVQSIELGHKKIYSKALSYSGAIFYNDIKDLRINTLDDSLASTTLNANKAHSYGAEVEFKYEDEDILASGAFGFTQTNIDEFKQHEEYEAKNIIDVPNLTASLALKYNFLQNFYAQSDFSYMGKRYYNISNSANESGYELINLGLGYTKDKLNIKFYVNNVLDKEYVNFMIYTPSNDYYHFGAPRVVGCKLSLVF